MKISCYETEHRIQMRVALHLETSLMRYRILYNSWKVRQVHLSSKFNL